MPYVQPAYSLGNLNDLWSGISPDTRNLLLLGAVAFIGIVGISALSSGK